MGGYVGKGYPDEVTWWVSRSGSGQWWRRAHAWRDGQVRCLCRKHRRPELEHPEAYVAPEGVARCVGCQRRVGFWRHAEESEVVRVPLLGGVQRKRPPIRGGVQANIGPRLVGDVPAVVSTPGVVSRVVGGWRVVGPRGRAHLFRVGLRRSLCRKYSVELAGLEAGPEVGRCAPCARVARSADAGAGQG